MKIGFVGETRFPVIPFGPGGLGRTTHMLATGLLKRGHEVKLHALPASQFDGEVMVGLPEPAQYDVILDFSHEHRTSIRFPDAPVENLIGDKECQYRPPNAVVESAHMQKYYDGARHVPAGMDVDNIPFWDNPTADYLVFMGLVHPLKGYQDALDIGKITGKKVVFVGPLAVEVTFPNYMGPVYDDKKKFELLGNALGLLCPYYNDAAPRIPLEAAACCTPTLCYREDGTHEHVENGITGFHCLNRWDMAEAVWKLAGLPRPAIREWVKEYHDLDQTLDRHEEILKDIAGGARW